jgi:tetratricopeptide (TPR) repeat protein/predicted Ser/Thr protein kinase
MTKPVACPDPETFEQLFSGELAAVARAVIADHAAVCRDCYELVDLLLDSGALATTAGVTVSTAAPELRDFDFRLRSGAIIDRYVIERRIGHGGMGVVYAARDPELGRGVAIKVLRAGAPADRLRREAQALAKLSHPNVVAVHDVGDHDGQTFIAMALVDGVTLRVWLEQPRTVAETLEVMRAAGRGIAAAHAAGMIHRDLKPDNIFVARDGGVLVGDFGLARDVELADEVDPRASNETPIAMTATGMILGTPAYMAPEQAKGEATAASDQFAFCVTAWEALYGERPYSGTTFATLQSAITAGSITKPADDRGVTAKVGRALRRGLAADPAARWGSVSELLRELAPHRRRWPWLAGAAILVVAIVAGMLGLRGGGGPSCDTDQLLDDVWGPARRTHTPAGTALDSYAKRWLAARHEVCMLRGELGPQVAETRTTCLDQRRVAFGVVVDAVATGSNPLGAMQAIDNLPAIDECARAVSAEPETPARLATRVTLSMRFADLESRFTLGRPPTLDDLLAFVGEAERSGDDGLLISALLLEAGELGNRAELDRAEPVIRRALLVAERSRDDLDRVRTRVALIYVLVRLQRLAEAHNVFDEATTVLARYGTERDQELELVRAHAAIASAGGDHTTAIELLHGYIAAREQRHDDIKLVYGYIALMGETTPYGHPAEGADAARKLAALEVALGVPNTTPTALQSEASGAQSIGQFARGIELEERAMATLRAGPHRVEDETSELFGLAAAYELAGDWRKMRELNEIRLPLIPDVEANRAERAYVTENIGVGYSRTNEPARAIDWLKRSIALDARVGPPPADDNNAKAALAFALLQANRLHEARVLGDQLLPILVASDPPRPWRRATVELVLARSLWEEGDAHERARSLALAADAERDFVDGIDQLSRSPMAAASVVLLQQRLVDLRAWRARHGP